MLTVGSLFAGIGGFDLGLERAGMKVIWQSEIDPYASAVLKKHWPNVPNHGDIRTITSATVERPDVLCGGFPCQDASVGNVYGQGSAGDRTGLYVEAVRLADEFECPVLMENVPGLLGRGFGDVLGALAEIGFDAEWECISARSVGADHERERMWILGYPSSERRQGFESYCSVLGSAVTALPEYGYAAFAEWRSLVRGKRPLRSSDGLSVAMERRRLRAIGNSIVPQISEIIGRAIVEAER
jgi:DNA (cytosine-5)-methyltransferase 1